MSKAEHCSHAPPSRARHLIFLLLHRAHAWMYDGSLAGIASRLIDDLGVSSIPCQPQAIPTVAERRWSVNSGKVATELPKSPRLQHDPDTFFIPMACYRTEYKLHCTC